MLSLISIYMGSDACSCVGELSATLVDSGTNTTETLPQGESHHISENPDEDFTKNEKREKDYSENSTEPKVQSDSTTDTPQIKTNLNKRKVFEVPEKLPEATAEQKASMARKSELPNLGPKSKKAGSDMFGRISPRKGVKMVHKTPYSPEAYNSLKNSFEAFPPIPESLPRRWCRWFFGN